MQLTDAQMGLILTLILAIIGGVGKAIAMLYGLRESIAVMREGVISDIKDLKDGHSDHEARIRLLERGGSPVTAAQGRLGGAVIATMIGEPGTERQSK